VAVVVAAADIDPSSLRYFERLPGAMPGSFISMRNPPTRFFLMVPMLALLFGGCASVTRFKGLTLDEDAVYVSGVPPVHQDTHYACGPACVAAVAAHWGVPLADFKARHAQLPMDTTGRDLQALAQEFGLAAFVFQGSMEDLQDNLRKGRPLIVMLPMPIVPTGGPIAAPILEAWNRFGPKPAHWVVVNGFTKQRRILVHDPASGPLALDADKFLQWWARKDNLCVLIAAATEP
jgi:predicted double-glycine peptidase